MPDPEKQACSWQQVELDDVAQRAWLAMLPAYVPGSYEMVARDAYEAAAALLAERGRRRAAAGGGGG